MKHYYHKNYVLISFLNKESLNKLRNMKEIPLDFKHTINIVDLNVSLYFACNKPAHIARNCTD